MKTSIYFHRKPHPMKGLLLFPLAAIGLSALMIGPAQALPSAASSVPPAAAAPVVPPVPATPAALKTITLQAGTLIRLAIGNTINPINSSDVRLYDQIPFKVLANVVDPATGTVLIARKSLAIGLVTYVKQRSFPMQNGRLKVEIEYVVAVDGQEIYLENAPTLNQKGKVVANYFASGRVNTPDGATPLGGLVAGVAAGLGAAALQSGTSSQNNLPLALGLTTTFNNDQFGSILSGSNASLSDNLIYDAEVAKTTPITIFPSK